MSGWLDIAAAAKYVSTSKRTLEVWLKERGLRYSRVGGKRLIKREWLNEFLESYEVTSQSDQVDEIVDSVMKGIAD
jgi:excisionase family DNA binding protein